MAHILVVDDERSNRNILNQELSYRGHKVETADNGTEALSKIDSSRYDLIVLDYMMPDMSGIEVLAELRKREDETPVIMVTAYGTIERAVEAMKEGACDFITRPFDPEHVALVVKKGLDQQRLRRDVQFLTQEVANRYRLIIGKSPAMQRAVDMTRKAARSNTTILLLGESGTGKEIFARNIHEWSERRDSPFVAINSVGLSKELLESELFGHEKGSFTGADRLKRGKVELAQGGTVFLDEIGDISPELQAKLLRFLEERSFERVGGTKPISVDIRIIAATNRDLEGLVKQGLFREDLFHRLNVVAITLPPLRERTEDIPILAEHFLRELSKQAGKHFTKFTEEALGRLRKYRWPGNVRELANQIERAIVLAPGPVIDESDLSSALSQQSSGISEVLSYRESIDAAKREVIQKALAKTEGNRTAAAELLGIESKYLFRLMKALSMRGVR